LVNNVGVDIDLALHFNKHIDHIVAKANSRIGLLFRGFVSRNLHVFRQAYITYIITLSQVADYDIGCHSVGTLYVTDEKQ